MEQNKKEKLLKEIADIEHEQGYIKKLVAENNMQKLYDYLEGELTRKHFAEKVIHNMLSSSMPSNTQESAYNALNFLQARKREKEVELAREISNPD